MRRQCPTQDATTIRGATRAAARCARATSPCRRKRSSVLSATGPIDSRLRAADWLWDCLQRRFGRASVGYVRRAGKLVQVKPRLTGAALSAIPASEGEQATA